MVGRGVRRRAGAEPAAAPARAWGPLPGLLLLLGVLATVAHVGVLVVSRDWGDPPWTAIQVLGLALAAWVRVRRPDLPSTGWFAVVVGLATVASLAETLAVVADRQGSAVGVVASMAAAEYAGVLSGVATVYLVALFPDGRPDRRWQSRVLLLAWVGLLVPTLQALGNRSVVVPGYLPIDDTPNPLRVLPFGVPSVPPAALTGIALLPLLAAAVILLVRYRHGGVRTRRGVRWLLVPLSLIPFALVTMALLGDAQVLVWLAWMSIMLLLNVGYACGIVQPGRLDVDRVLRRTLVYGVLWLAIAGTYVGLAATVGVTAQRYLSVPWAVVLTVVAALLFQPARARLERLADRWVFGTRTDSSRVIARLGDSLAETYDLASLLPRMGAALEEGLGVTWARVRLASEEEDREPQVVHPVVLDGEQVGAVECGPKRSGAWTEQDDDVVATFARQAALAVHNVRLAQDLATHAAEVAASRTRLVRAQESERRRIERNIHDGVQQDLVALIALAGQAGADGPGAEEDLELLRSGLTRVLDDLRDLARGIHPSLLSDSGLLTAVEALTARHPVPVELRADPGLRGARFPAETEAACYFAVSEALANSLKHAGASRVDVALAPVDGLLVVTVTDDGLGFDPRSLNGSARGLNGMVDRFAALDGRAEVRSVPGRGTTVRAEIPMAGAGVR